ncbi:lipocalin family protein [Olleya sp. R77988]|uniref:lipocalin family protein n=1 Tax=Olleya sp. R77988 TaxID=3093875 RepID=UPI0037CC2BE6
MKKVVYIALLSLVLGCSKNPEDFKQHLTGYWEIKEVTLKDGSKKEYTYNDTIDYIEINDTVGFRKKMKPNINGTFQTSKSLENFVLKVENDSLNLYYKTPFSNWKETILHATKDKLQVINQNKDLYLYQRYVPIVVN